jgi:hypothetical protein
MKKMQSMLIKSTKVKKNDNDLLDVIVYLMEETKINKLKTKNSLNEFISRLILLTNTDYEEFIEKYEKTGNLVSIEFNNQVFDLKLEDFMDYIGLCTNQNEVFNFDGTLNQFLVDFKPFRYGKIKTNLKKPVNKNSFFTRVQLIVNEITNNIDDEIFTITNSDCPIEKTLSFYAPSEISEENYLAILEHLLNRVDFYNFKNDTDLAYSEEMFEKIDIANEVINIAYGVKNGYISSKAIIGQINFDSNPFYEVNYFKFLEEYINESTYEYILQKWNSEKWMDKIPFKNS